MRFGLVHRVMTNLLAVLGVLALVTSGELGRTISILVLLGLAVAVTVPERWQNHPAMSRVATIVPLVVLALQLGRLAWGAPLLEATVEFAIALQIVRLATRRGAAQDQQVIVLAWLHMIAGTVLGGGLAYGICFAAFLIVAPGALVLSHLRREVEGNYRQGARDRTGLPVDVPRILRSRRVVGKTFLAITCLLSVPIFVFTATIFVMFPRVGLSLLLLNRPATGRMVGFSDHVDLGGVGTLRTDPTIVLRVEVPDLQDPPPDRLTLYLRGTALDQYDGSAWSRSRVGRVAAERVGTTVRVRRFPRPGQDRSMKLDLEPIDPPVVFLPPNTVGLKVRPRGEPLFGSGIDVFRGSEGEFRYLSPDNRGIVYEAFFAGPRERFIGELEPSERARYLSLPELQSRIADLAREWTEGAGTSQEKARRIETRLKSDYQYDLASPSGSTSDPLDHFLFVSKRGHCEYFSTAMAVMLRQLGVPTRNVTGFVGGTYNRFGDYYSVRQGDAHSWVEAYLEDRGWVRFDPTPPSGAQPLLETTGFVATVRDILEAMGKTWDRRVVRYDLQQQLWLFSGVRAKYFAARQSIGTAAVELGSESGNGLIGLVVIVAVLGSGVVGFVLWRRRRTRGPAGKHPSKQDVRADARVAIALYQSLQEAMAAAGIPRGPGTPPLKHARRLRQQKHPFAEVVQEVTERYLGARFGDESLTPADRQHFEDLIGSVRNYRPGANDDSQQRVEEGSR